MTCVNAQYAARQPLSVMAIRVLALTYRAARRAISGRAATTEARARRDEVLRLVGKECRAADLRHSIAKARRSHQATYSMRRDLVRLTAEIACGIRGIGSTKEDKANGGDFLDG